MAKKTAKKKVSLDLVGDSVEYHFRAEERIDEKDYDLINDVVRIPGSGFVAVKIFASRVIVTCSGYGPSSPDAKQRGETIQQAIQSALNGDYKRCPKCKKASSMKDPALKGAFFCGCSGPHAEIYRRS